MLGISIIAGVGVREYYRKFDYKLSEGGYMVKEFKKLQTHLQL